ncbi:hypothetical protein KZ813_16970 [Sphingomonas sp. RHCKR7]|uniref:hypothetical protein n=1 Tax=Sphingomonas folli TaxID=2862497 RepID=UPI001CA582B0|nr:hypothetical protein [Sphingomonas folli]MBW6528537.1 hypothetical protein [Sphingomonas folli]
MSEGHLRKPVRRTLSIVRPLRNDQATDCTAEWQREKKGGAGKASTIEQFDDTPARGRLPPRTGSMNAESVAEAVGIVIGPLSWSPRSFRHNLIGGTD